MQAMRKQPFDMIVLDWRLPDIDGIELIYWIRQTFGTHLPVLFLTNRVSNEDIVAGLDAGADDYLVKPALAQVLLARIGAMLRRTYGMGDVIVQVGPYMLDPRKRSIFLRGLKLEVTPREFDLAIFMFRNIGRLISNDLMERMVWGRQLGPDSRTVATHLSRLRIKLMLGPENGVRLSTIYAHGYRLDMVSSDGMAAPET